MFAFASPEWIESWVSLANNDTQFTASAAAWEGSVGITVEADVAAGVPEDLFLRLEGRHGQLQDFAIGNDKSTLEGTKFVLRAPYVEWKRVIQQELQPIKGIAQGRIKIRGHLPEILKWTRSIVILAELAGRLETTYPDE
jgi:putative sterol carrier protein